MKTKHLRMMKSFKLFILLFSTIAFGQDFTVKGEIHPVKEDGLYQIQIPHDVRTHAETDLRDFRIWDAKGNQVPYFIKPTSIYKNTKVSNFTEFSILSNTRIADTSSTYIFKNPYKTLDQAVLLITNYQGSKNYKLEGSNNQKEWFGIVNNGYLNQLNHLTETSVYKVINFPLCTYQYIKIVFDDQHSLPINLLKIGKASAEELITVPVTMEKIPVKSIAFLEVEKKTQIHITFDNKEVINQIKIDISGPDLYSRNATFYSIEEREEKNEIISYRNPLATFTIRSDKDLVFNIPTCIEKDVYLEIDNKDNPKLQISAIHFMQKPIYLVAALKKQSTYKVTAGNKKLRIPEYDLSHVANPLNNMLPLANIENVIYKQTTTKPEHSSTSFWQQAWFMWSCIGLAALVILYFAFNLLKELNTEK